MFYLFSIKKSCPVDVRNAQFLDLSYFHYFKFSVQQNLFELLGIMTKEHPEKLESQMPQQIRDILMKEAESQLLKGEYVSF